VSQNNQEKKTLYTLNVMRRDQNHIAVIETTNYDEVYELYIKLTEQWSNCIKQSIPFSIVSPVITSFDPGLIYEITVLPIVEQNVNKYDNPYHQKMIKNGFASAFPNRSEVLDGGYT